MSSKIRLTFEETLELKAQQRYEQGKAEGELETRRTDLCRLLEKRFGPLDEELRRQIEACTDVPQLRSWFDQALEITAIDELAL